MGHIFQILGRFNICLSSKGFSLPLETWIDDILHGADALTLNFSGDFAIQGATGHFIHQLIIILLSFLVPMMTKMWRKSYVVFSFPIFPLISEYNATEFLALYILYHSLGQRHRVG